MIPKVIHYCWFGGNPLPPLAQKCIASWKTYLPDYEIKEWNEENFNVNIIPYTQEAYAAKKYAFVSDYARFWILYNYGGLYFDTDVEIIKPIDDIIANGPFMGCETDGGESQTITVAPGLGLGAMPQMEIYCDLLCYYNDLPFSMEGKEYTIVGHTTKLLRKLGLQNLAEIQTIKGCTIYPAEYFNPINIISHRKHITPNTRTIHHYAASWMDNKNKESIVKKTIRRFVPEKFLLYWNKKHKHL